MLKFLKILFSFQCHLATLLKTAEELRIKGLAEVSWRDEDGNSNQESNQNGIQTSALSQVSTVMESPKSEPPNKKKRGRPPIDDYEASSVSNYSTPKLHAKILSVTNANDENFSNDAMSSSDHDMSIWEEEQQVNDNDETMESDAPLLKVKMEVSMIFVIHLYIKNSSVYL